MKHWFFYVLAVLAGAFTFFSLSGTAAIVAALSSVILVVAVPFLLEQLLKKYNPVPLVYGFIGFALSLIVATWSKSLFTGTQLPLYIWQVAAVVFVALGTFLFAQWQEPPLSVPLPLTESKDNAAAMQQGGVEPKILDTSIIIDGRIIDLSGTGFVEGPLIVPNFVLREIQLISDSSDPIKRNRGRRGLDMLNQLQKRDDLEIRISYKDYSDTREVDAKLVRMARELGGKLVTNDFNLNKVAELQGVHVLNINNLANALKPVVLPGEELDLQVVKEGKDENQGIGYLDDGTMVVIENGGKLLGKKIRANVTSVIQTNAGKMIFTKVVTKS